MQILYHPVIAKRQKSLVEVKEQGLGKKKHLLVKKKILTDYF